jgi:phage terminase small subunit
MSWLFFGNFMPKGAKPDLNRSLRNVVRHPSAKNVEFLDLPDDAPNAAHVEAATKMRPTGLSATERKFWNATAPQMVMLGRLKPHYAFTYADYCCVVVRMAATKRYLDKEKWTYESFTRNGIQIKSRPEVGQLNDDWRKWRTHVGMFGLAPSEERNLKTSSQGNLFGDGWDTV